MEQSKTALQFQHVSKVYPNNGSGRFALRDVSFSVEPGKTVAIVGRSGSGKSTLLHLSAGIDVPSQGDILVEDSNLAELSEKARTLLRRQKNRPSISILLPIAPFVGSRQCSLA